MRRADDFRATVRGGVRVGRPTIVVHADKSAAPDVLVGFVVAKSVGNAVTRNSVKRRLRHLARGALVDTPPGSRIVLRALPSSGAPTADLGRDVPEAWRSALDKLSRRGGRA